MLLVVEDHEDTRQLLLHMLTLAGYEAIGAESGEIALEQMRSQPPALVILDYTMPGIDGLEVLARMRSDEQLKATPVIMFSALDGEVREQALRAGVSAYVSKGAMDWAELRGYITRLVGPGNPPGSASVIELPRTKDAVQLDTDRGTFGVVARYAQQAR